MWHILHANKLLLSASAGKIYNFRNVSRKTGKALVGILTLTLAVVVFVCDEILLRKLNDFQKITLSRFQGKYSTRDV